MNDNFLEELAQAPPNTPSADDADASNAARLTNTANAVAAAAAPSASASSSPDALPAKGPQVINPKSSTDTRLSNVPSARTSLLEHFTNALTKNYTDPRTAALTAKPGGGVRSLFLASAEAMNRWTKEGGGAPAQPAGQRDPSWGQVDADQEQAHRAPPPPPLKGALGAASRLVSGINKGLGGMSDLDAAPGPGGAIGAFGRVLGAGRDREMKERQATAVANAQMLHEQGLVHKLGNDAVDESIKTGQAAIANFTAPPPEGGVQVKPDATGKTSDELNEMIKSGELRPTEQTAFPDGKKLIGQWPDGQPKYRTTYSVITLKGTVPVSVDNAKLMNDTLGGDGHGHLYSTDPEKLQPLPATYLNTELQRAYTARANQAALKASYEASAGKIEQYNISELSKTIMDNPALTNALKNSKVSMDDPTKPDPYWALRAFDALQASHDPRLPANWQGAFKEAATNTDNEKDANTAWREKVASYEKAVQKNTDAVHQMLHDAQTNPKEIEGHTPAFMAAMNSIIDDPKNYTTSADGKTKVPNEDVVQATKAKVMIQQVRDLEKQDEKDKAANKKPGGEIEGNPDLMGDAYLQSLPPSVRATVQQIGTGQIDAVGAYLLSRNPVLGEEVAKAYPDFDGTKVKQYLKAYQDFTSGKTSSSLNAAGAVLQHLEELKKLNTDTSRIYGTSDYNAFNNKLDTISGELAAFYQLPKTNEEIKKMASTLGAFFNRDAAINTQIQSMADKLTSFRNDWVKAAPSEAYEAKMPNVSPEGRAALARLLPDFVAEHPEFAPPTHGAGRPAGVGPDWKLMQGNGKTVWLNPEQAKVAASKGATEVKNQ